MANLIFHAQTTTGETPATDDLELDVLLGSVGAAVGDAFTVTPYPRPNGSTVFFFDADPAGTDAQLLETEGDADTLHGFLRSSMSLLPGVQPGQDYEGLALPGLLLLVVPAA